MGPFVEPGEDRRPAGGADRGGHEHIGKAHAVLGQGVHVRRLDDRVSGAAHHVPALVVGQDEDNVRFRGCLGGMSGLCRQEESGEDKG